MKAFYLVLTVLVTQNFVFAVGNEFVTFWAPKYAVERQNYSIMILPKNLERKTDVAIQIGKFHQTERLINGQSTRIVYENKRGFGRKTELNLTMTLYIKEKTSKFKSTRLCSTNVLSIKPDRKTVQIFIQTDKPIYKPGDEVKFRILAVDRDLKPWHMNNIEVSIIDPLNRSIFMFDDLEDQDQGLFVNKFKLSSNTILGDWKILVIVDKQRSLATSKIFPVQKYTAPLFNVNIKLSDSYVLFNSFITITFYGKYPFGEFVSGQAELDIRDAGTHKNYFKKTFRDVDGVETVTYNIMDDLKIHATNNMDLEAFVTFTEPQSQLSYNKSAKFSIHTDSRHKIVSLHPQKFLPGFPFGMKIFVNNWKNDRILSHSKKLEYMVKYNFSDNWNWTMTYLLNVKNGIADYEIMIPKDVVGVEIEIKFLDCEIYKKRTEMGKVEVGVKRLNVYHEPKNPNLNETVRIIVQSNSNIDEIFAIAMSRYGIIKSGTIKCQNTTSCEFDIDMSTNLMPHTTVTVYLVKDMVNVIHGKTEIRTDNFGANHLDLKFSTTQAKPKDNIEMSFETTKNSKIYLLAFDKRLTYLRDGNDINNEEVAATLTDYDGENYIVIDDMMSWHECSKEELLRVDKGRKVDIYGAAIVRNKGAGNDDDYYDQDYDEPFFDDEIQGNLETPVDDGLLRDNFPETWIFETVNVDKTGTAIRSYVIPDTMTTWEISAFSINKVHGLAVMPVKELTVKSEFFIEMVLPYSIRFKEVFRLNILIYNYIDSKESLDVTVELQKNDNFQIIQYKSDSQLCSKLLDGNSSKSEEVPNMSARKVSFYIRASPKDDKKFNEEITQKIIFRAAAKGTSQSGQIHKDDMQKELLVKPVGVRTYDVLTNNFNLDDSANGNQSFNLNTNSDFSHFDVFVSRNFLSDLVSLSSESRIISASTLEEKIYKMKETLEIHRYFLTQNKKIPKMFLIAQYQDILSSMDTIYNQQMPITLKIFLMGIIISAMKIGAIPQDKHLIQSQISLIKNKMSLNDLSTIPWLNSEKVSNYFKIAFLMIPMIRHQYFINSGFDSLIGNAFAFLENSQSGSEYSTELSIAAYVYAISKRIHQSEKFLVELEKFSVIIENSTKCYKTQINDTECSKISTAYATLAYLQLGRTSPARPYFYWLIKSTRFRSFTFEHSIVTEAIAEAAIKLNISDTSLKVMIENERNFQTTVEVKNENFPWTKNVKIPRHTSQIRTSVNGRGFCSVSIVSERIIKVPQKTPKFNVSIEADLSSKNGHEKVLKVCAVYQGMDGFGPVLDYVFYEIEMPSGYVCNGFDDHIGRNGSSMEAHLRRQGSVANIYFNKFHELLEYCASLRILKVFDVQNTKDAAVKVYDHLDKRNAAIEFYSFSTSKCQTSVDGAK